MAYPVMSPKMPWSLVRSGFKKTPHFNTNVQRTPTRRGNSAISYMPYPAWDFSVDLNKVLGGEAVAGSVLQDFLSVYLECCGSGGLFLFTDPNDNQVSALSNLLPNGGFEDGHAGWYPIINGTASELVVATEIHFSGTKSINIAAAIGADGEVYSDDIPVIQGLSYKLGAAMMCTLGNMGACFLEVEWLTAAKAHISYSVANLLTAMDVWQYPSVIATPPSNAAFARVYVGVYHPATLSTALYADNIRFGPCGSDGLLLNVTPGAASPMGRTGDGVSNQFQLARKIGNGVDIIQHAQVAEVLSNGTIYTTEVGVSSTGVVTFPSDKIPPAGADLTWIGSFQHLCRFTEDTLDDLSRVSKNGSGWLWDCSSIAFESEFI